LLYASSILPAAFGVILQERVLKKPFEEDVLRFTFWANFYSIFGYLLAIPMAMIPYFGSVPAKQLIPHQIQAFICFFQISGTSYADPNNPHGLPSQVNNFF
jgi:hypothetical protein